ncbi:MAG: tripartite tricarboxylate transporter substrate-binding protein [Desulfobacterales bacterium]|nr:tripartite tricarboxylate transporter substrate-binding protein [Desulfobacterales bacterium]MDJ0991461.1 tripartite tricarboxylate transporter substrate-binding protein [Desulfobacterales bacterium]
MKKSFITLLFVGVMIVSIGIAPALAGPKKMSGTECLAPAGAGGGWDFTCRVPAAQLMQKLDLIDGSMKVVNMSGSGGGKAFSHVVTTRNTDEKLIVAASAATATRLAQRVYGNYKADDVRWVGALGMDYGVIVVGKDSPYKTLDDLMAKLKTDPRKAPIVGASSKGGWDHLKALLVAKEAGIKNLRSINYIPFDNGGKALLEVVAGRAAAFTGDSSEIIGQLQAGELRVLAVLSDDHIPALGDAKTAKEQGYDVVGGNWRAFYAPAGISDEAYDYWVSTVKAVANSPEWSELREKNGLAEFTSFGKDFDDFVREQIEDVATLSMELGIIKK